MPRTPEGLVQKPGRPGYYYRDQRGGRDRLVKLSDDPVTARTMLRELRGDEPMPRATVAEVARLWLKSAIANGRNERGQQITKSRTERYLLPALGYRPVGRLNSEDCRAYRVRLEGLKVERTGALLSAQSVHHLLADLRCLLLWAVEARWIARSPFPRRLLPRIQERAPQRLTDEEAAACQALPEPYGFALRFLIGTGLRWSEAVRAQASDLDRDMLIVTVSKSKRIRRIPLGQALRREIAGRVGRLVHVTSSSSFSRRVRRTVPGFHAHQTRHTFAYRYLERGGTLHGLQEMMGHADLKTTMIYLRGLSPLAEREARTVAAME